MERELFDVIIGELLAEARKEKGLSQRQFAKAVGIPRGTISNWELGLASIPFKQFIKVCEKLGVNYSTLADIAWEKSRNEKG